MNNTLQDASEGEVEGMFLSEDESSSKSLISNARNIIFGVIMAMGASGCVTYGYYPTRPYYPERSYDYGYNNTYRSAPPTHVIKAFPLRIERIDRGNNRGGHHNDQRGNHRGNHRR